MTENRILGNTELPIEDNDRYRNLSGSSHKFVYIIGILFAIFQLITLIWKPIDPYYMRNIHLTFSMILLFALVPMTKDSKKNKISLIDKICIGLVIWVSAYLIYEFDTLIYRITTDPTTLDIITSTILVLLILEMVRRTQGWVLPILSLVFLIYSLIGNYLPGLFWHRGYSFERVMGFTFSTNGIYGIPLGVSATYVFMFVLFGAFLQVSGVTKLFVNLALSIVGKRRGGPAQVAVVTSALFGTISGSSVGNVATTGTFTIPLIKGAGYSSRFAGGVEAVASTGGQILPPIMGAGAFLMAELLGVPYLAVATAALIPAVLFFFSVFVMVDLEASKKGLLGIPKDQIPSFKRVLLKQAYLLIPIIVLLISLFVFQNSPLRAAFYSLIAIIVVSWIKFSERMTIKKICEALVLGSKGIIDIAATTAIAGIVIGVISLTGLGTRFSMMIMSYSNGILLVALILAMIVAIILGMGLPTVAAYAISASIIAPGLIELGVNPIAAHLFILYFASLSAITPPVAVASFAAAALAKEKPMVVSLTSFKLGLAAFIIPYMFVYGSALLMEGSWIEIAIALFTSLIGIYIFGCALQGWFIRKAGLLIRGLLFINSLLFINTTLITDIIAIALLLVLIPIQFKGRFLSKDWNQVTIHKD